MKVVLNLFVAGLYRMSNQVGHLTLELGAAWASGSTGKLPTRSVIQFCSDSRSGGNWASQVVLGKSIAGLSHACSFLTIMDGSLKCFNFVIIDLLCTIPHAVQEAMAVETV